MTKNKDSVSYESYQEMAEYYYEKVDEKPFNAYYERPGLIELLPDVDGKKVLDAGCAAGWLTDWLVKHGADVTAVDFSPNMVEMTKKRVGDKAKVVQADLNEPLDFLEDESIEIIISSLTLHYLKDWDRVMKEFSRILVDEGKLAFSVHHPFMDYSYFDVDDYFEIKLLQDEWGEPKVKVEFYRRPLSEIIRPVTENGFVIEKITEPMPNDKFKEKNLEAYERLTKKPQFLFVRARKE
ncbi:MAG: class I SAM-dependent methyltransferase [Thermoplasmata archaeon]